MQKTLLTLFFLLLINTPFLLGQALPAPNEVDLSGIWAGQLFQQSGGYADSFGFILEIEQNGYSAKGTSRVFIDDIAAAITFVAIREINGHWLFTEREVINSRKPIHLEWCYKQYRLSLKYSSNGDLILSGPWWGQSKTGNCIPGHIVLRRSKVRA